MINQRVKEVVEDLEKTVLDFMAKHKINHDEYRVATKYLVDSIKGGEETLMPDIFLEARATDISNEDRAGSPEGIEGPFYLPGAPVLSAPYVLPQRKDEPGIVMFFRGRITNIEGEPLGNVELDFWHADANGEYSNIHPGIPDWNLRGRIRSEKDGSYEVRTILPPPYEIPKNGPTGRLVNALGRHYFRPAHMHVMLRQPGYEDLISQLYFEGGEYIDNDLASAVRDNLIIKLTHHEGAKDIEKRGLNAPFYEGQYDFVLRPLQAG
ncbi:MAG: hypothetical protein BGN89_13860 [Alphaproteobacteria bacterium 64-6]|uniref:dioxygenase family protein n=1 Tax=Sphingobium chungbukense TaxID=56193 RepID=UPI00069B3218|nr:dioxygenase [Sphingobium chungbukense]OJU30864.1 MAG: hypothetical protein BGN89_13860 [Alphaproteobacteria bacterium 64-6]